ncbi:MAG: hypothetical protein J7J96_08015 [Sulfurimonas sp.]|nr:hypothetical protein [Sulfurimonas sp.]
MKKIIKSILLISLNVYFIIAIFLYIKQNDFLYFPTKKIETIHKEKVFINENESISTTVLNFGQNKAIIYFGGNAENVDYNANNFKKMFKDYTVYLVKYRGYGTSSGTPTEKALYSDALHIYDSIKTSYFSISVIGRSLGSGIATYLASKRIVEKLALITPFDSIQSVAQEKFLIYPMSLLLKDKYRSIDRVHKIKSKTLILMAQNDKIIKNNHSKNLANQFPTSQITIEIIENENHNSILNNKLYIQLLTKYFRNANKS